MFTLETEESLLTETIPSASDRSTKNLVLCHGYGAGLGFFYKNLFSLSQAPGWQVFAIDWLGMGRSSRPKWTIERKSNQTWDDIVDDVEEHFVETLEEWRKKVGIEKMTLMGHSLGGYFSVCYSLKYPQHVEKLILVSPVGVPENPEKGASQPTNKPPQEILEEEAAQLNDSLQAETIAAQSKSQPTTSPTSTRTPPVISERTRSILRYLWDSNITPMSIVRLGGPLGATLVHKYTFARFPSLNTEEKTNLYDYLYHITTSKGSGEYALAGTLAFSAYARNPLIHRLGGLQMPTTFVYGTEDWMDYRAAEKASKLMKVPVKIIRISSGGHHMYIDNPEEFNREMAKEMIDG
ncbi:Alpha/Beta hydrolase protein [Spinellus fusiger]|nr:Alpha/Beta hydrolase protein [Spinellus fusiger]